MSENVDPIVAGLRKNTVLARKLAVAVDENPSNQMGRKPFGVRDQNAKGDVGHAKEIVPKTTISENMDFEVVIKQDQEQPNGEQEIITHPLLEQPANHVNEGQLSDVESMEVDWMMVDPQENIVSFAEREIEYHVDYQRYLSQLQEQKLFRINPKYMSRQKDIDFDMRATLVDWLCELTDAFKLHRETYFLAVGLIDRFLSVMSCSKGKLQLVGITAIFIAAKIEEVCPPSSNDLVHMTDDTYDMKQLLSLEVNMMKVLKYQVAMPTASTFLSIFMHSKSEGDESLEFVSQLEFLAQYICELTLLQGRTFLPFLPSEIATAALYVAADTLKMQQWKKSVFRKSGHSVGSMDKAIKFVHKFYTLAPGLEWTAIREKYSQDENLNVAKIEAKRTITVSS